MMKLIAAIMVFGSCQVFAGENHTFECYRTAYEAAKAIDAINFGHLDQSSGAIYAQSQMANSAKILVAFEDSTIRAYSVKISKNRYASLKGDSIINEIGCKVESIQAE
jgi:hypothetical protein